MSTTPTFSAQLLGQTEKAANAILDRLLAEPGLTEPQWVTLTLTAISEGSLDSDQLREQVAGSLKVEDAHARALITELADAQLLHLSDDERAPVALTDAGHEVYTQIRAQVSEITQRLWGDLPTADLATAGRVLSTVLARANAQLASANEERSSSA